MITRTENGLIWRRARIQFLGKLFANTFFSFSIYLYLVSVYNQNEIDTWTHTPIDVAIYLFLVGDFLLLEKIFEVNRNRLITYIELPFIFKKRLKIYNLKNISHFSFVPPSSDEKVGFEKIDIKFKKNDRGEVLNVDITMNFFTFFGFSSELLEEEVFLLNKYLNDQVGDNSPS